MSKWISVDYLLGRLSLRRDGVLTKHDIETAPYAEFKWIPASERLPEHEDAVLCFIKNGQQDILQFDKFENLWVGMQWTYKRHAVTHWMPLPEPPQEKDDGNR